MNHELPDAQAGFRKGRRTRDQIANMRWIIVKEGNSRKTHMWDLPRPEIEPVSSALQGAVLTTGQAG